MHCASGTTPWMPQSQTGAGSGCAPGTGSGYTPGCTPGIPSAAPASHWDARPQFYATEVNEGVPLKALLLCVFVSAALALGIGWRIGESIEHGAAIAAHAGRWAVNPETGETRFEYGLPK